jgi:hypothetical protein
VITSTSPFCEEESDLICCVSAAELLGVFGSANGKMGSDDDGPLAVVYQDIIPFFLSLPSINHLAALILCLLLPGVFWGICCLIHWYFVDKRQQRLLLSCSNFVVKRAGIITFVNLVLMSLMCANQTTQFILNTTIGVDIMYYTKVDLPEYDAYDAVKAAGATSIYSLTADLNSGSRRRLTSSSAFTLIYHTKNWDELFSYNNNMQYLTDICLTESNILANNECLGTSSLYSTILPKFFDDDCNLKGDPANIVASLSADDLSAYFEDGINSNSPESHIIISVTTVGRCHHDEDSEHMSKMLNSYAVGSTSVTYAESSYLQDDFVLAIIDAAILTVAGVVLSVVFFMFWIRGVVCGFATLYCIIAAIVAAAGSLETWRYGSFSAFNVMSVFILIGISANAVLLFDSAWRGVVAPGKAVTGSQMLVIYSHIGEPTLFTICAACLSLFSKLASPVIVISQLGAFMGTSVLVLYAQFHYVIIPLWITSNRIRLPQRWHDYVDGWRVYLLGCLRSWCGCFLDFCQFQELEEDDSDLATEDGANNIHIVREKEPPAVPPSGNDAVDSESDTDTFVGQSISQGPISRYNNSLTVDSSVDGESNADADDNIRINANVASIAPHSVIHMPAAAEDDALLKLKSREDSAKPVTAGGLIRRFLKSSYFVWCCRMFLLFCTVFSLVVIGYLVSIHFELDFGIPQLFTPDTNLGQCFVVLREYKSSILDYSDTSIPVNPVTTGPTFQPTLRPTSAPTFRIFWPTATPTHTPTLPPTFAPTLIPTFGPTQQPQSQPVKSPTPRPSISMAPTPVPQPSKNPMYMISGCYGITFSKEYKDTEVFPQYDSESFVAYSGSSGFMDDQVALCNYVESNRISLNVDPDWIMERDCLPYQFGSSFPPESVTRLELLAWGIATTANAALIGIEIEDSTQTSLLSSVIAQSTSTGTRSSSLFNMRSAVADADDFSTIMPIWVCNNFSVVSPVPSLIADTAAAQSLLSKWKAVFAGQSSASAATYGVSVQMSSDAFTLPLLASEVLTSIEIAGIVSLLGFIVLLFVFTFDFCLTLSGTLIMTVILCMTFCLHLYFVTNIVDLLDIVVLIAIIGMIVDFPIHMLKYFQMKRKHQQQNQLDHLSDFVDDEEKKQLLGTPTLQNAVLVGTGARRSTDNRTRGVGDSLYTPCAATEETASQDIPAGEPLEDSFHRAASVDTLVHAHGHSGKPTSRRVSSAANAENHSPVEESNIFQEVRDSFRLDADTIVVHTGPAHTIAYSLFAPCATSVLVALPLLLATIELLRKTGEYIVTMAIVSYFITCFVCPYILELACQTNMMGRVAKSETFLNWAGKLGLSRSTASKSGSLQGSQHSDGNSQSEHSGLNTSIDTVLTRETLVAVTEARQANYSTAATDNIVAASFGLSDVGAGVADVLSAVMGSSAGTVENEGNEHLTVPLLGGNPNDRQDNRANEQSIVVDQA